MNRSAVPPPVTRVLAAAEGWLPRRMGAVESRLAELAGEGGELLSAQAGATLAAGGKRLRPMLVLVCAGDEVGDRATPAATAIELVHMATLVHDDVLDAAPLRRGSPTVVARAGREVATAVGDLLFSRAFAELAADEADSGRRVGLLARASVGLAQGELAQRRDAFDLGIAADRYLERCRLKTARLFECACLIGSDPGPDGAAALATFGSEIGLAFQLLDDVLDVTGPAGAHRQGGRHRPARRHGDDADDPRPRPRPGARRARPAGARFRGRGARLRPDRATGVLDEVRADARARVERAKAAVERAPLGPQQRELLTMVADGVVERYS